MINRFKPTLRDIERIDIYAYIEGVKRVIQDERYYPYRNCLNCCYFTEGLEQCKRWNTRPPARVIAYGCSEHFDIEAIPF